MSLYRCPKCGAFSGLTFEQMAGLTDVHVHAKSPFSWYRQKTTHATQQRAQALALNERAGFRRILPHWPYGLPDSGSLVR